MDLINEISRTPPDAEAQREYNCGAPIMYLLECAVCEQESERGWVYTAVNYVTGNREELLRRKNPIMSGDELKLAELARKSRVAGAGHYQINRPVGQRLPLPKAKEILRYVFTEILPKYGYVVRQEQIELAEHILEALTRGETSLVEAGTGFGKSEAYLIPLVIVKLGRMNDRHNLSFYPEMQFADMSKLIAVVSTASIALQRAIVREYIPKLSRMLLENGIITAPLNCLLRKGREHYVCKRNLRHNLPFVNDADMRQKLEQLLLPNPNIDLAEVEGLSAFLKQKICVPGKCPNDCKYKGSCRFLEFREQAGTFFFDVQVTNHQLLIADIINRAGGRTPLLPNYQLLIVDEAHKFADAARGIYGTELSDRTVKQVADAIAGQKFKREGTGKLATQAAKKLRSVNRKLFDALRSAAQQPFAADAERQAVIVDGEAARQLSNYRDIAERLITVLRDEIFAVKAGAVLEWAQDRYHANVSSIVPKEIFAERAELAEPGDRQNELHYRQATGLHRAICRLPGIAVHIKHEQENRREPRFGMNPERYVLQREHSSVKEVIWRRIEQTMLNDKARCKESETIAGLVWDLEQLRERVDALAGNSEQIRWLELDEGETRLCATPGNLPERLYDDQWKKHIPTVFTSGTLSASGDFTRAKQTMGLTKLGHRLTEIGKQSPFDYRENCLLYLPEHVPFPDPHSERYIEAITDETERLIRAGDGHAAVLFTSYTVMGIVYNRLKERALPFKLFRLERSTSNAIERFRNCKTETGKQGVLFASGALWEGIDIPGDALSMLIIVKLPFPIPDALAEYERTQYPDFYEYRDAVLTPEMLIRLKQGFGRLIRTERDTGVVAILDCRANLRRAYREYVLAALPDCRVTGAIADVIAFMDEKKTPEYFA